MGTTHDFTDAEKLEQAVGNAVAIWVATDEFLRQRGIDPRDLQTFFGERHAEGWVDARGDLEKIAYFVALNMTTFGFETSRTVANGEATVEARWAEMHDDPDWPIPVRPALGASGVAFEPIMAWLGVGYSWDAGEGGISFHLKA